MAGAGTEIIKYPEPLSATLIDGSSGPAVTAYVVANVVLTTKCGEVVLPRTHIDVLEGPEKNKLLYIGQAEEKRLNLRTFADQLEDLARDASEEGNPVHVTSGQVVEEGVVRKNGSAGGKDTLQLPSSKRYKRRLSVEEREPIDEPPVEEILPDGKLFAGEEHWRVLQKTDYLADPKADKCYVTTQALAGL